MAEIFISYARGDRPRIERLAEALQRAGHSIWWDRQIAGGSEFSQDIERELASAAAVVVAWSEQSAKSRWVRDEAGAAADDGKLVAISLDGSAPPMGFRQFHVIDFSGDEAAAMADLEHSLALRLGTDPLASLPPASAPTGPGLPSRSHRPLLIAAMALIFVLLATGAWWLTTRSGSQAASAPIIRIDRGKSIVVMPFRSLGGESDDDWFAPALTTEITNVLGRVPDLVVASESSAAAQSGKSATDIASALSVANVLEGSVLRTAERLRINVALVDVDGKQVWSNVYDRAPDDLIAVQEDIASEVARAMGTLLEPAELAKFVNTGTRSIDAYNFYLQGRTVSLDDGGAEYRRLMGKAIEADPDFALPYISLASRRLYALSAFGTIDRDTSEIQENWTQFQDALASAQRVATRKVDEDAIEFLRSFAGGNIRAARDAAQAQYDAGPGRPDAYWDLVHINNISGHRADNKALVDQFREVAPDELYRAMHLYQESGFLEDAQRLADQSMTTDDREALAQAVLVYIEAGRTDDAQAAYEKVIPAISDPDDRTRLISFLACAKGDPGPARELLGESPSLASRYRLLVMTGRKTEARDLLLSYDRAEPPFPLLQSAWAGWIDVSLFPNLSRVFRRDGLEPAKPLFYPTC